MNDYQPLVKIRKLLQKKKNEMDNLEMEQPDKVI